jgi:hypothetical protein
MAGKVFFRDGKRHRSRFGHTTVPNERFLESITSILGKKITPEDWNHLARAIAVAKADHDRQTRDRTTRKDSFAQLRAMLRLKGDDALLQALRGCDRATFEAVRQAQIDAISNVLWHDGVFIDAEGEKHHIPPDIEIEREPPCLPMGINGLRSAIVAALESIKAGEAREDSEPSLRLVTRRTCFYPSGPGNLKRNYQVALAKECATVWRLYGGDTGRAWCSSSGNQSRIIDFAFAVFREAGMVLSGVRLAAILKSAEKKAN